MGRRTSAVQPPLFCPDSPNARPEAAGLAGGAIAAEREAGPREPFDKDEAANWALGGQ